MPNENISLENEVFAAYRTEGQAIYAFMFSPEAIINGFKAESIECVASTKTPTVRIRKLLNKYHSVILISNTCTPRITVFSQDEYSTT